METVRPKSRFARTFQKVCNLRTSATANKPNGIGICMLKSQNPNFNGDDDDGDSIFDQRSTTSSKIVEQNRAKQRAVFEAVIAKIFASSTSIKAAYAELQMAQRPYNGEAVQSADQAVVDELRALSELKRDFIKKDLNLSPQVTMMLAEIQEQQSLMRTYEITIKKMEIESREKESEISSLKKVLTETASFNRSLEKKLNASGPLFLPEIISFERLKLSHFVQSLNHMLRSVRAFVKLLINEMESSRWDLDAAAKAIINGETAFARQSHRCFAFESFVCEKLLLNFDSPNYSLPASEKLNREQFFNRFKNLRSADPIHYLTRNPDSSFANFTRLKYASVVHAKMECSFFGNLNLRKLVNSSGFPDSGFFAGFAEMAKRAWILHCMAFSLHENVTVFQIRKGCRFSEVYMQNVISDEVPVLGENAGFRVGFTVSPGFKIGNTVVQSQVYLSSRQTASFSE